MTTMELTERQDMPDQVRAKLHKITGYVYRDAREIDARPGTPETRLFLKATAALKKILSGWSQPLKRQPAAKRTRPAPDGTPAATGL
jgi:hypothetical protein